MKQSPNPVSRDRLEHMLTVQAQMHRETLPDAFTLRTMASVRTERARASQHAAAITARTPRAFPAFLSLACLAFLLAVFAIQPNTPGPQLPVSDQHGADSIARSSASADAVINNAVPIMADRPPRAIHSIDLQRAYALDDVILAPFREEADAIVDRGRSVGVAMLTALPAQPRAWSQPLRGSSSSR